jgi:hypothetical protein
VSNFYGTKIEFWTGFGPVGNSNTEKNSSFQVQNIFFNFSYKNIVASALKRCIK